MRPIKLVMSAFGPYAGIETIDFNKLADKKLFLVTGITGAGKTTIFDAISYALYGLSSGDSRGRISPRSDFASEKNKTFVEFEFEVNNKVYKITRSPEQQVPKVRGAGFKKQDGEIILELPGESEPIIKGDANDKIIEIIGVKYEQFKQIVMLPQGEFRKLLESSSAERIEIFRDIFGTQPFLKIQNELTDKKAGLSGEIEKYKTQKDVYIKSLQVPEEHELECILEKSDYHIETIINLTKGLIEDDNCIKEKLVNSKIKLDNEVDLLKKEYTLSKEDNNKIEKKRNAELLYNNHLQLEEDNKIKLEKIAKGKKALEVTVKDHAYKEYKVVLTKRKIDLEKAKEDTIKINETLNKKYELVKIEQGKEDYREKLSANITKLQAMEQKLNVYVNEIAKRDLKIKELHEKELKNKSLQSKINLLNKHEVQCNNHIQNGSEASSQHSELVLEREKLSNICKELKELYDNYDIYRNITIKYNYSFKEYKDYDVIFNKALALYNEKESLYRNGIAGILADELTENMPCPVCGSFEHPNKAIKTDDIPSDEQLKALKEDKDKKENNRFQLLTELQDIKKEAQLFEKNKIIEIAEKFSDILGHEFFKEEKRNQMEITKVKFLELENKLFKCNELITEKEILIALMKKSQIELGNISVEKEEMSKISDILLEEINLLKSEIAVCNSNIDSIEDEIPEQVRTIEKLNLYLSKYKNDLEQSKEKLKNAIDDEQELRTLSANRSGVEKEKYILVKEAEEKVKEAEKELELILKTKAFQSYDAFKECCMSSEHIENLQNETDGYEREKIRLKANYEALKEEVKDLEIKDLNKILEIHNMKKKESEDIVEEINKISGRININTRNLQEIIRLHNISENKEKEYAVIAELEQVSIGKGSNMKKMTFESYILTSYFDEIIDAANLRFDTMSNGRFKLERKVDIKGNGKKGLDLDVRDFNTGRSRDVKTLSGGESFKASLSLALGLADVIQRHAGGISIDTMFIDEGFGTLDATSLDNAIECLLSLQSSGRLIGIISHVSELKERIEGKIEVKSVGKGSSLEVVG